MTIARFRVRHEQALTGFLVASLRLCAAAGMVRVGTIALDGTKLAGNAATTANRTLDKLEAEVAQIQLKDFGPTRNRKVVGSNPTSGSISVVKGYEAR